MKKEIRLSGFGGQGLVLAGYILGKAGALYEGLEVVMTQSYGPEARGGACSSNVILSDSPVDYPFVEHPDIFVAMSQEAYEKYHREVKNGGLILIDDDLVDPVAGESCLKIPATRLAEKLGNRIVANILFLGFLSGVTGIVSLESLEKAVASTVRPRFLELNKKALMTGYTYAQEVKPS